MEQMKVIILKAMPALRDMMTMKNFMVLAEMIDSGEILEMISSMEGREMTISMAAMAMM